MKSWWLTVGFVFLVLYLGSGLEAAEKRVVEIRYDASRGQTDCLYVWVNSTLTPNDCVKIKSDKKGKIKRSQFDIKPTDNVILMMKWQCDSAVRCDTTAADIHYTVMGKTRGLNILKIILENLTKLTVSKSQKAEPSPRRPTVSKVNRKTCLQILPVKDELVSGGSLIATFNKKNSNGRVVASSGPWLFQIENPPPRYTVSHGFVITNTAKPNQQESTFRDDDPEWRLVQSPFTFVNLQPLSGSLYKQCRIPYPYVSVGFQLGSQPFDDLVIGATWRAEVGNVGVNVILGGAASRETEKGPGEFDISHNWGWAFGLSLAF